MAKKRKVNISEEKIVDVSKAEHLVETNYKKIIMGVLGLALIAGLFIFFTQGGSGKEMKAETAAAAAQGFFSDQQWQLAIDGSGNDLGFAEIATKYKGTNMGNLAHYYVGISNMKIGQFENAVNALQSFKDTKDPNVNALAYMNLADAQMELDNPTEALKNYKKAANADSEGFDADLEYRYALALVKSGDINAAKTVFEKIMQDFPNTVQANTAEQYLAGL